MSERYELIVIGSGTAAMVAANGMAAAERGRSAFEYSPVLHDTLLPKGRPS